MLSRFSYCRLDANDAWIMRDEGISLFTDLQTWVAYSNHDAEAVIVETHLNCMIVLFFSGPYKLNGVPLRRVNQRYVIATSTKVPVKGVDVAAIDDKFFARAKEAKKGTEDAMFEGEAAKATVISAERKAAQTTVDAALIKNIETLDTLSAYISAKFSLSKADKPHAMVF